MHAIRDLADVQRYISDLEQRLAYLEGTRDDNSGIPQTPTSHKRNVSFREPDDEAPYDNEDAAGLSRSDATSPEPPVLNQLASELPQYIQDRTGKPIYLGTSSNWSFGRRILATAYERILRSPLPVNNLLFQGQVYHLDWTNVVGQPEAEHSLPSADFAIYLINAVKFHCGQIFHLFDEEEFMQEFAKFHDGRDLEKPQIWHTHYLLMLALGKAFVVRIGKGDQPPGADHFIDAMKYLPNIAFLYPDELNVMELLCCAALYLHSLDFRSAAYTLIGQALRIALEKGLNTNMRSHHVDEKRAQRCRKIWWTVLVLDRQMSALQGVPMAIRDEDIHADLPHSSPAQREALQLHITLSNLTADIVTTVYGPRVGKQYFINTKAVLKKIGDTTDHLNERFPMARTSRLAAYLHLLHHQVSSHLSTIVASLTKLSASSSRPAPSSSTSFNSASKINRAAKCPNQAASAALSSQASNPLNKSSKSSQPYKPKASSKPSSLSTSTRTSLPSQSCRWPMQPITHSLSCGLIRRDRYWMR